MLVNIDYNHENSLYVWHALKFAKCFPHNLVEKPLQLFKWLVYLHMPNKSEPSLESKA